MDNYKKILNFIFELTSAKTTSRTGWQRIGIKVPESLADHSALSGQIAYVLAPMEGANPDRSAVLALFHDLAESRLGDANWVARIYTDYENKKETVISDQLRDLPVKNHLESLARELKEKKTKEAQVAWDADFLDMAVQSKYYTENGNQKARLWFESVKNEFTTASAKKLYSMIESGGIDDWWMELEPIKKKFQS